MPVAFLARQVPLGALGQEWAWLADVPPLLPARIAYIGLRDVDPQERGQLRALGIAAYTMADVDELGIAAVVKGALRHLGVGASGSASGSGSPPLHLSFDIDACDPSIAPSTGTVVPGGLTYREAHYLCEAVAHSGALQSMDMVEVNPQLCGEGQGSRAHTTASTAAGLCASAWGKTVLGVEGAQRRGRG
jgi:arginase